MAVIIVAGTFFGAELDKPNKSDTPIYTIIFSLISIFLALYYVFKKIINQNEKK
jgi:F0F1-type ATP synthase assembly protein I|tara:strand:+ start:272 stop:433 length:162 start_codon:yes stop_codon:yes gene_type:complete